MLFLHVQFCSRFIIYDPIVGSTGRQQNAQYLLGNNRTGIPQPKAMCPLPPLPRVLRHDMRYSDTTRKVCIESRFGHPWRSLCTAAGYPWRKRLEWHNEITSSQLKSNHLGITHHIIRFWVQLFSKENNEIKGFFSLGTKAKIFSFIKQDLQQRSPHVPSRGVSTTSNHVTYQLGGQVIR